MKNELKTKVSRVLSSTKFKIEKHSPEILVGAGLIGATISICLAVKATPKAMELLNEKDKNMEKLNEALELSNNGKLEGYDEDKYKRDVTLVYTQTGLKLIKNYAPSVSLTVLSFASIIYGHNILRKRNLAIAAAYTVVNKSFKKYRDNVIDKFGEEIDRELRFNSTTKELKSKGEDGKTVKTKAEYIEGNNDDVSLYARFFDASCRAFDKNPEYNMMFLKQQQDYANEKLKAQGHLFLNEVYDLLDIPRSQAGQVVGWIYDEKNPVGDNYVDFGLYRNSEGTRRFVNGLEYNILLDFNVDGVIYNLI